MISRKGNVVDMSCFAKVLIVVIASSLVLMHEVLMHESLSTNVTLAEKDNSFDTSLATGVDLATVSFATGLTGRQKLIRMSIPGLKWNRSQSWAGFPVGGYQSLNSSRTSNTDPWLPLTSAMC